MSAEKFPEGCKYGSQMEHPVQRELSERSIEFYKHLDFAKLNREDRGYDITAAISWCFL